jgi:tetratricopeptide (TPR) repeat protein
MWTTITFERTGNIHLHQHRLEDALALYQEGLQLKQSVADRHDGGPRDLSYSFNKLGDVHAQMSRHEEALDYYQQSLEMRRQVAEADPEDNEMQRGYTVGMNRVADALRELGRFPEALELYRSSLARRQSLVASQPDNPNAAMDLAMGHYRLAQGLAAAGDLDESDSEYSVAHRLLKQMAAEDPGNTTVTLGVAEVSGDHGRALLEGGRPREAEIKLRRYIDEIGDTVPLDRRTAVTRQGLAAGYHNLGQAQRQLGGDGCESLQQAKALYDPAPDSLATELASCLSE